MTNLILKFTKSYEIEINIINLKLFYNVKYLQNKEKNTFIYFYYYKVIVIIFL